jgi:hypothetical protein
MKPIESNAMRTDRRETPDSAEARGLRTFHRDAESAVLDRIAREHGTSANPERLAWERNHPASLETLREFERAYQSRFGEKPPEAVVGFYDPVERSAHVRVEHNDDIPGTIAHELLHGLTSPEANSQLPPGVIEGVVENYARQVTEREPQPGELAAYEREVRTIRAVEENGGVNAVERAIFKGDIEGLVKAVDHMLRDPGNRRNP